MNRRRVFRLSWLIAAAALVHPAYGLDPRKTLTQYSRRIWQQEQGLPQPTIYSILQTHEGYLWLGTQGHLVRFDGAGFTDFTGSPGAPFGGGLIQSLLEDDDHGIWIGSTGGLTKLAHGTFTHYGAKDGLPNGPIGCLARGRHGEIWICTEKGVVKEEAGHFRPLSEVRGAAGAGATTACETTDGTLWAAALDTGLSRWDGTRFVPGPALPLSENHRVQSLLCARDGELWVGTDIGLYHMAGGKVRVWTMGDGLASDSILALAEGPDGGIWAGTRDGISRLRDGELANFRAGDGLSHSTVLSLAFDREGSLWVGTKNGLNQFLDGRVTPYTTGQGLPSNDTGPVFEDSGGSLWVGTLGAGLSKFDGRRFTTLNKKDGLASDFIYSLSEDGRGDLWVGTRDGLSRIHNGRVAENFGTKQGLPDKFIRVVFRDVKGVLWAGTPRGLAKYQNGRFTTYTEADGLAGNSIVALGSGRKSQLFVATENGGLAFLRDGKFTKYLQGHGAAETDYFYADPPAHVLWMGTLGGGLRRYRDGKATIYSVNDGLFDDQIYAILLDDESNLWLASSRGIFVVNEKQLDDFAEGRAKSITSIPLGTGDVRFECRAGVQPAAARTRDGRLWFSTTNGLVSVDRKRVQRSLVPPPPALLEEVMVNGQRVGAKDLKSLRPPQNNVEIHFTSLTFLAPERVTFRTMLEGYDKTWKRGGTPRLASYTNLPPGHYRFRVSACKGDRVCNDPATIAEFTIVPYFFETPPFFAAVACLTGLFIWLAYQLRIRRLKEQFQLVLAERSRIARELHDTLLQGLSSLTMQMQALSTRMRTSAEKETLDDILHDAGVCLKDARKSLWGLRSPRSGETSMQSRLGQLARQAVDGRTAKLSLSIDKSGRDLPPEVEYHLLRIAREALANAVRHSGAGAIEVSLKSRGSSLVLSVKDNGRGFDASPGAPVPEGHYGLVGIRERAAEIGAELKLTSGAGIGTDVTLILPAGKRRGARAGVDGAAARPPVETR